jgi:UDP-glucose 4-epimerase
MHTAPLSPYGANKLASESLLYFYARVLHVPTAALRFFNVYGPRQDPSSPYTGVISAFLARASRNEPLVIHGDGEQTRDFVYVGDVAAAVAAAAFSPQANGVAVNVGTGQQCSINQLARTILEVTGSSSTVSHAEPRQGDIRHSVADISRARELLVFAPSVDLADGLAETARWFAAV